MIEQKKINPSLLKNSGYLLSLVSAVIFSSSIPARAMPPKAVPADEHEIQRRWMNGGSQGELEIGFKVKHIARRRWRGEQLAGEQEAALVDHAEFNNDVGKFINWFFQCTYNAMDPKSRYIETQTDGRQRYLVSTRSHFFRLIYDPSPGVQALVKV